MKYGDETFKDRHNNTKYAAERILEIVLLRYKVQSAIDIGCGVGTFLNVILNKCQGNIEILGVDGEYVDENMLVIPRESFFSCNLEHRIILKKRYDLVISLEVAEHLSKERAQTFIEDLTALGDVVLFSAAIPYQGGKGHINEQYLSYWVELFRKQNYILVDCIRPAIWEDEMINWHYRQNVVLFCKHTEMLQRTATIFPVDMIHPRFWENKNERLNGLENNLIVKWGGHIMKMFRRCRKNERFDN